MSDADRRSRILKLAAGAAFLAVAVVLVLIVIATSGSGDGGDTKLEGVSEVNRRLAGIPQHGMVLGDPGAPVEVVEFADLQCPYCKAFTEDELAPIIENQVKKGEAKIAFHNFVVIGEQSLPAGAAALAAGAQGRGWNFVELFYANQGSENSGYADDAFLEAIAKGAGVHDIAKWNEERQKLTAEVEATSAEAQQLGFTGTPSLAIKGPQTEGLKTIETPSTGDLEAAIAEAG
ncbi:MAG TPA: thioredoxin domain-containing protein [Solirubrobacterales bacterium]|jgi:protein-disulfide isomerase|nr:thioredoxin domain-containing protein [Solirubrobacterales bacterium]